MPVEYDLIPDDPTRAWVRVTTFEGPAETVRSALLLTLEHVVPTSRQSPGWQGTVGLTSPDGRRALTLSFWESSSALAGTRVGALRDRAEAAGVSITDVDHYEVVFHETPDGTVE